MGIRGPAVKGGCAVLRGTGTARIGCPSTFAPVRADYGIGVGWLFRDAVPSCTYGQPSVS